MNLLRHPRLALALGLGVLWVLFVTFAETAGVFSSFQEPILSHFQSLPAPAPAKPARLALAEIKVPSDKPWPWSRFDFASLLHITAPYSPHGVIFAVELNEEDPDHGSFDQLFAKKVSETKNVAFSATLLARGDSPAPANLAVVKDDGAGRTLPQFSSGQWPLPAVAQTAPIGISNLMPGEDDIRSVPLVFSYRGQIVPSVSLQAAVQYLGADWSKSDVALGSMISLRSPDGELLRTIPVDTDGRLRLRWHADRAWDWRENFLQIPVLVVNGNTNPGSTNDLRELANRQLWVGRTDAAANGLVSTPLGALPTVEVQMLATRQIIEGDYIRTLPFGSVLALFLPFAVATMVLFLVYRPMAGVCFALIGTAAWTEAAGWIFPHTGIMLPVVAMYVLTFGLLASGFACREWETSDEDTADEEQDELDFALPREPRRYAAGVAVRSGDTEAVPMPTFATPRREVARPEIVDEEIIAGREWTQEEIDEALARLPEEADLAANDAVEEDADQTMVAEEMDEVGTEEVAAEYGVEIPEEAPVADDVAAFNRAMTPEPPRYSLPSRTSQRFVAHATDVMPAEMIVQAESTRVRRDTWSLPAPEIPVRGRHAISPVVRTPEVVPGGHGDYPAASFQAPTNPRSPQPQFEGERHATVALRQGSSAHAYRETDPYTVEEEPLRIEVIAPSEGDVHGSPALAEGQTAAVAAHVSDSTVLATAPVHQASDGLAATEREDIPLAQDEETVSQSTHEDDLLDPSYEEHVLTPEPAAPAETGPFRLILDDEPERPGTQFGAAA